MDVGYYKPQLMLPAPLPTQASNAPANVPPSFMSQAQGMAGPGVTNGIYAQPGNQGELTKLAYRLAGPAPQPLPQPAMTGGADLPMVPPSTILTGRSDGVGSMLGAANSLNSTYNQGNSLYQNLVGSGASLSGVGSGAAANGALADAGFGAATPALDLGAAGVGGLSAVGGAGTGALGATTFAGASPEAAAAIDAAAGSSGAGSALAASGLSTALPIAAIGWAVADALNKSGDIKSGGTSALVKGMVDQSGWKLVNPKNQTYALPDGRWIQVGTEARAASEALRRGDPNAQQIFDAWLATAKTPKGG